MGNAIRYVKKEITTLGIDIPDEEAKLSLINGIDRYIRERITVADQAIVGHGLEKIRNGDIILTYAGSSLVLDLLLAAHKRNIDFRVIVLDARPKFEGKEMLNKLTRAGIRCTYALINALGWVVQEATKTIIGAQGLLSNGSVLSRTGTSQVLLMSHNHSIPTIILCETYKFSDKVQLDSFVSNELDDPEELIVRKTTISEPKASQMPTETKRSTSNSASAYGSLASSASSLPDLNQGNKSHSSGPNSKTLQTSELLNVWKENNNFKILNLVYDVTPGEFIDVVITELGLIPCTSVPVVIREYQITNS